MTRPATSRSRRRWRARAWAWTGLVCAAIGAVAWVGSTWISLRLVPPRGFHWIGLSGGEVDVVWDLRASTAPNPTEFGVQIMEARSNHFGWFQRTPFSNPDISVMYIPLWPFILAFGVPSAWVLIPPTWWRTKHDPHQCAKCGYDLSGLNSDGRVCPECGRAA